MKRLIAGLRTISDHEFDQMAAAREKLKPSALLLLTPELQEEDQSIVLLSLDNQRFEYWYSTLPVATPMIVQPKIDGCSLGLRYVDGELVHASKRCGSDVRDVVCAHHPASDPSRRRLRDSRRAAHA